MSLPLVSDFVAYGLVFGLPVGAATLFLLWHVVKGDRDA